MKKINDNNLIGKLIEIKVLRVSVNLSKYKGTFIFLQILEKYLPIRLNLKGICQYPINLLITFKMLAE